MFKHTKSFALLFALALALASCGGATSSTSTMHSMDEHGDFHFGEPADASAADRVIEITANNDLTFDPTELAVAVGETITFKVTNTGSLDHDFTLGDSDTQDEHEAEMIEMMESGEMMMHDEANAISLPAGETKELTWHFTEAGTVLIGCHTTGHYAAGMIATITVG